MRQVVVGIIVGLLTSGLMVGEVWLNLDKPLRPRDDITWQYFLFDNNFRKLTQGEFGELFNARMFYPREKTLAYGNSLLGQSLLGLPAYLLTGDVVTAANSVILIDLVLAFGAMYLLAYRFTHSTSSGLIAGMIYTYNPYVMAHLHHEQLVLQWLPLLFLLVELLLERVTWWWSVALGGTALMLLVSSFYYALFALVIVPMYALMRWWQKGRKEIFWKPLFGVGLVVAVVGWGYLGPFRAVREEYGVKRSIALVELLSANPQDYLFTAPNNWLYGWWAESPLRDSFAREHPTEHSLFPGLVGYGFLALAVWMIIKKKGTSWPMLQIWLVMLGIGVVLSLGPRFLVYRLIYTVVPGADSVRAVSRWAVMGFLSLAVLSALGWQYVSKKLFRFAPRGLVLALLLLGVEYRTVGWVEPFSISEELRTFYQWLDQDEESQVIVELPIANDLENSPGFARSFYDDGQYLLYATWHDKALVNGHHSFIPEDAYAMGRKLTAQFPTQEKLDELRRMGVDVVSVHEEEYGEKQVGEKVVRELRELGLEEAYNRGGVHGFRL